MKESEKRYKYLDLARGLKKLWNMKVTVIPMVIGALGTATKGLLKGLEELEIIGRRLVVTPLQLSGVKNSQRSKIIIIIIIMPGIKDLYVDDTRKCRYQ